MRWQLNNLKTKILLGAALVLFLGSFSPQSWALNQEDVSFYHLRETKSGEPYALDFKNKKMIPVFVSMESVEKFMGIITASGSQTFRIETQGPAEFLDFSNAQQSSGIPVHVFPYASRLQYTVVRPMTWGVGSSYLFGTFLVLFLFWAITRNIKKEIKKP